MASLRLGTLVALLIAAVSLPVSALEFSIQSVNCTQLDWSITLSQTEWSISSYVELFFVSQQGGQNYSLLYSALGNGDFPSPGSYDKVTNFGSTRPSGEYLIGVGLADMNGNILTTTTSSSGSSVQVTAIDPSTYTFGDCTGNAFGNTVVATSSASTSPSVAAAASSSATTTMSLTSSAPTSTMLSSVSPTAPASSASTAVPVPSAAAPSSSSASAPVSTSALPETRSANKAAIAGGVVGGILLLLIVLALARWCSSRRRTKRLSRASQRMPALRPLTLSEKMATYPSRARSPKSPRQNSQGAYASKDTLEFAALGTLSESRLSESTRRRSEAYTPYSTSHADELSIRNMVASYLPAEPEQEIKVLKVPFSLEAVHQHPTVNASSSSAGQYQPPDRNSSQIRAHSNDVIPAYPNDGASRSCSRSRSDPLVIDLPPINTSPLTSPTNGAFQNLSRRISPVTPTFKIPRVSVPTFAAERDIEAAAAGEAGMGEDMSRQPSWNSSVRRLSAGGATFASADDNPFVDAAETQEAHGRRLA
ncbi:hypothetical protein PHBOTO_000791 [Pseudozyma hubeiensis]|nr:hypothetical protein PHBOTO_000791 [Pseudozyma hubeiensis]